MLYVDAESLGAQGSAIGSLADVVSGAGSEVSGAIGSAQGAVGDPVLSGAVGSFGDTVAVAVQIAQLALSTVGSKVGASAQDYTVTDAHLAHGFGTP